MIRLLKRWLYSRFFSYEIEQKREAFWADITMDAAAEMCRKIDQELVFRMMRQINHEMEKQIMENLYLRNNTKIFVKPAALKTELTKLESGDYCVSAKFKYDIGDN